MQRKYPADWEIPPNTAVTPAPAACKKPWDQLLDSASSELALVRQEAGQLQQSRPATAAPAPREEAPAPSASASASTSASASATASAPGLGVAFSMGSLAGDVHASLVSVSRAQYERELCALQVEQSQLQSLLVRALNAPSCDAVAAAVVEQSLELHRNTYKRLRDMMSANLSLHEVRLLPSRLFSSACLVLSPI